MFVIEMFILIYGMLNSAEEMQERKRERKSENYTHSRYSENRSIRKQI